ncbi:hypothetical protein IID24_03310 [Patescibacteria group bacterium]|nr:hypothetical protein [Patescibacteria group bacterium]
MSKYKNTGKTIRKDPPPTDEGLKDPENLDRYGDKSPHKSKKNLTKGAFGKPRAVPHRTEEAEK